MSGYQDFRDVHTEHCCSKHGCKYGNSACTVTTGKRHQSFACEECESDKHDPDKQCIATLERELAELRARPPAAKLTREQFREAIRKFNGAMSCEEKVTMREIENELLRELRVEVED